MRVDRTLSNRWDKIRAQTRKYVGFYARVLRENQSGHTNDDKVTKKSQICVTKIVFPCFLYFHLFMTQNCPFVLQTTKVATLYATVHKKTFGFMHCWNALKVEPKWQAIVQGSNYRGTTWMSLVAGGTPSDNVNDVQSDYAGLTGKMHQAVTLQSLQGRRPCLIHLSQLTTFPEFMTYRWHIFQKSEDKLEKQENIEFLKDVELKNLEVRNMEIEMQQTKFKSEDRLQKNTKLKELLAIDMDQLPEDATCLPRKEKGTYGVLHQQSSLRTCFVLNSVGMHVSQPSTLVSWQNFMCSLLFGQVSFIFV